VTNSGDLCSIKPVSLTGWAWQPFLDLAIASLQKYDPEPYPIPSTFLHKVGTTGSKSKPLSVTTATWACSTSKLRQVRAACVEAGSAASVLNFVANPRCTYDLPFFGADFVTLANGHLLALDLQPVIKTDSKHTQHVWDKLLPIYHRWKSQLPDGGPIPEEAQQYFSPCFLWTRLPLGAESDSIIESVVMAAFKEYLECYLSLIDQAQMVSEERSSLLLQGQHRYTSYRSAKDPARGMLTRFYGAEWTESYIHDVLFDLQK